MYPAAEVYSNLASSAFKNALLDAAMLQPTSIGTAPLFPAVAFDIRLSNDANMVESTRTITLPLTATVISIGRPYGFEIGYGPVDPAAESAFAIDTDIWIPFTVYATAASDQDFTEKRLLFARDKRQNVFANYGLDLQMRGQTGAKPRPNSATTGLVIVDYRWRFFFSR